MSAFVSKPDLKGLVLAGLIGVGAWLYGHVQYDQGHSAGMAAQLAMQNAMAVVAANGVIADGRANVAESRQIDNTLVAQLTKERDQFKGRAKTLEAVLAQQAAIPYQPATNPNETKPPLIGQSVLDVVTLCLLDAERDGGANEADSCTAGRSDEEIGTLATTATEVGGGSLAIADQELSRRYKELATRHDALVDWVDRKVIQGE